ncbi:M14 family metallopeptidase [Vagococcus sp.]|uniref:M14 family metallopeptidase n=1 Tax=Vagococcus sp. TaxID=1933889 RepID=UPI003F978F15
MRNKSKSCQVLGSLLVCTIVLGGGQLSFAAEEGKIAFSNKENKESNVISLTDKQAFEATVELPGQSKADLDKLVKNVTWKLSRDEGIQDKKEFPHQYLGDDLSKWQTFPVTVDEETSYPSIPFFKDIKTTVDQDKIKLTFNTEYMYGVNGIDGRARAQIRNSLLDYTGTYELELVDSKEVLAKTKVEVKPYENYHLYEGLDQSLLDYAKIANEKGIYAEVKEFGTTAQGRPMQALFIADSKKSIEDYQKLNKEAMQDPKKVLKEVESGKASYKVPIVYSNIHSDENPGVDAVMEFTKEFVDKADSQIPYRTITELTPEGKKQVEKEKTDRGVKWSEMIQDKGVTGVGYIRDGVKSEEHPDDPDAAANLSEEQLNQFYEIEDTDANVKEMLENVFFILVPSENADAHAVNVRTNGNGFDLNRDNTYQVQPETQAMTQLIAEWNPVNLYEIHGFYNQFQVEPCSPTHDPNVEYDLFIENALKQGEAFGATAIVNNDSINSFQMPMRDYLKKNEEGIFEWVPFDDMSTSYTPQYSFLHGAAAYTVEVPYGNEDAVQAVKYALVNNGKYVGDNKQAFYGNQLKGWVRGVDNEDAESIRPYYVSQTDEIGKEADVFRKKHEENDNFFPEYYVIPTDSKNQRNRQATSEIVTYLLRNDVQVKELNKETKINEQTYPKGTMVVDMHQPKRNMANAVLYDNVVIENWTSLYSEPLTAFADLRGFSMDVITKKEAIPQESMTVIEEFKPLKSEVTGEGSYLVLDNNSIHAVQAVNQLIKDKQKVSMIESGDYIGDFLISEEAFDQVKDDYILHALKVKKLPEAKEIKKSPKVYIPGKEPAFMVKEGTDEEFGLDGYFNRLNTSLNWDFYALKEQLNFDLADSVEEADVIIGNQPLNETEEKAVLDGKPYIALGSYASDSVKNLKLGFDFERSEDFDYDALTTVEYIDDSLVTANYKKDKDQIMYGYGGNMITKTPKDAKVLVKTTKDDLIEGFMSADHIKKYKGSTQVAELKNSDVDVLVFANSITNKAHQQDDYRYVANALFAKELGDKTDKKAQQKSTGTRAFIIVIVALLVIAGIGYFRKRGKEEKGE